MAGGARVAAGGAATAPLGRYARRQAEVDAAVTQAYVGGVSTRDMGGVTEALLGKRVGKSTVSRVTKRLEDQVEELRRAPITEPITYLYLDATFVDARWARTVENVSALVAYGVGLNGKRQLLGVHIGAQESEASWTELLTELVARGLSGVKLIIRDEHAGLIAAARKVLPEAKQQRCTVHLIAQRLLEPPRRHQKRIARELVAVLHAESLDVAKRNLKQFRLQFAKQFPEAVECLERGFDDATATSLSRGAPVAHPLDERPRAPARRDQAPHARHRRLPRPRERTAPHHRGRSPGHEHLERPRLPRHDPVHRPSRAAAA